jgi:UDP-3-O-[3-hydroxymyristoyl] glucosamine N-acyltransferase
MADPRFFERRGPFSLKALADAVAGELEAGADHEIPIHAVAPLELAGADATPPAIP